MQAEACRGPQVGGGVGEESGRVDRGGVAPATARGVASQWQCVISEREAPADRGAAAGILDGPELQWRVSTYKSAIKASLSIVSLVECPAFSTGQRSGLSRRTA